MAHYRRFGRGIERDLESSRRPVKMATSVGEINEVARGEIPEGERGHAGTTTSRKASSLHTEQVYPAWPAG